jgi:hypothetical protein
MFGPGVISITAQVKMKDKRVSSEISVMPILF